MFYTKDNWSNGSHMQSRTLEATLILRRAIFNLPAFGSVQRKLLHTEVTRDYEKILVHTLNIYSM